MTNNEWRDCNGRAQLKVRGKAWETQIRSGPNHLSVRIWLYRIKWRIIWNMNKIH
jgi:hypothetical protein